MTRLNTYKTILTAAFWCFFTLHTRAQINVGGGLVYGTEIETLGLNFQGGYLINEHLSISAGYTHFLPKRFDEGSINSIKLWEVSLEASYWFYLTEKFFIYPSMGMKIMEFTTEHVYTSDNGELDNYTSTGNRTGLFLGGGFGYRTETITPFVQAKGIYSDFDVEYSIALGVLIFFN